MAKKRTGRRNQDEPWWLWLQDGPHTPAKWADYERWLTAQREDAYRRRMEREAKRRTTNEDMDMQFEG